MHNIVLGIVAVVGVAITVFMCARIVRGVRRGASRDVVIGYFAMMLIAALAVVLLLRLIGS